MVPFVGLTGGMGAGKSTALKALEELGAQVLSTDAVVHELYGEQQVKDAVVERWGAEVDGRRHGAHVETERRNLEQVDEHGREQMLAGVLLHVVEAARPVDRALRGPRAELRG